jgi:hypothetical protein
MHSNRETGTKTVRNAGVPEIGCLVEGGKMKKCWWKGSGEKWLGK